MQFKEYYSLFFISLLFLSSILVGVHIKPIKGDTIEIMGADHPSQVRVGETFYCHVEIIFEVTGPAEVNIEVNIYDINTGAFQGTNSFSRDVPDGVVTSDPVRLLVILTAPDTPGLWNLQAELLDGNVWPFSIEVIGDEDPPYVRITMLEAEPSALQVGDRVDVYGVVDYSIPDGSYFILRYSTSHGVPELFGRGGSAMSLIGPWMPLYEDRDVSGAWGGREIPLAGEEDMERVVPNSRSDRFSFSADAPLEPTEWIWYFRIVFIGADGEEVQLGSRDVAITVSSREEAWAVIDFAGTERGIAPTVPYTIMVRGRYFFADDVPHDISIEIRDTDRGGVIPGDAYHDLSVTESGIILEYFYSHAPDEDFDRLNLIAELRADTELIEAYDFIVYRHAGPAHFGLSLDIDHVRPEPEEAEFGSPLDIHTRVQYSLPTDVESELSLNIYTFGLMGALASDTIFVRGEDDYPTTLRIPEEFIPPRNGEWLLVIVAEAWTGSDLLSDEVMLSVIVRSAEEGISGGSSDWMALDGWPSTPIPFTGETFSFWGTINVETDDPLPQQVWVTLTLDGEELMREAVTFQPGMEYYYIQSPPTTLETVGSHIVVWTVDPDGDYIDPNPDNNQYTFTFTASEPPILPPGDVEPPGEEPLETEEFDFYVTASPTERTLASSTYYTVTVNLVAGEPEQVQLTLLGTPAGLSYAFNTSTEYPSYTSELTITGGQALPSGTYSMMIKAANGDKERYKPILLTVEEGADYELSISPRSTHVTPGETVECEVSVSSNSGYGKYVNLVLSELPKGVTGQLETSSGIPDFQSQLHLDVGEDVKPGAYTFTVSGSGADPHRAQATLYIKEEGAQESPEEEEKEESTFTYYLPLIYLILIIAAIVAGITWLIRRRRRQPGKPRTYCIECGREIPLGSEFCTKCGAQQETK